MSIKEIISEIQSLPFSEKIRVMEEILKTIRTETKTAKRTNKKDVRLRRKSFKVEAFDLGEDVVINRDEIYFERGI